MKNLTAGKVSDLTKVNIDAENYHSVIESAASFDEQAKISNDFKLFRVGNSDYYLRAVERNSKRIYFYLMEKI